MAKLRWISLAFGMAAPLLGQGCYSGNAFMVSRAFGIGSAATLLTSPYATASVSNLDGSAAAVFADYNLTRPLASGVTADAAGRYSFCAGVGTYTISLRNYSGGSLGAPFLITLGGGGGGGTTTNASLLTSGTLPNARLNSVPNSALASPFIILNGLTIPLGGQATISTGLGPSVAPTGTCTTYGAWVFSQDGKGSYCNGSAWVQKI